MKPKKQLLKRLETPPASLLCPTLTSSAEGTNNTRVQPHYGLRREGTLESTGFDQGLGRGIQHLD